MTGPRRPSFAELVDWLEGRLSPDRAGEVAAHVDLDARLQRDVAWIEELVATGREAPLVLPPDDVRTALRALFRNRDDGPAHAPVRLLLLFDSRRDRAPTGVRALDTGPHVQLAFTDDAVDVVLDVHDESPTTVRVDGQVFLRGGQAAVDDVSVRWADGSRVAAGGDPLGRFTVDKVPSRPVRLELRAGDVGVILDADLSVARDEP